MWGHDEIGIDLGTSTVLVYMKGRGVVLREPAVLAVDRITRNILAVGDEAKRMVGRTPAHVATLRPLRDGTISDLDMTARMMRYFMRKVIGRRSFFRPRAVVCVPSGMSPVEKASIIDATVGAGARRALILDSAVAGAMGIGFDVEGPYGCMIVDIGGGLSDISVVTRGRAVLRNVVKAGGDRFDDAIIRYLRRKHSIIVGERTAEEIKITIGSALPRTEKLYMDVTGRHLLSGLPRTVRVLSEEMTEALEEPVRLLHENIHAVLEHTPPELAADIFDRGIMLIGGGAQLFGLDRALASELKLSCTVLDDPEACVVTGAGRALDALEEGSRELFDMPGRRGA